MYHMAIFYHYGVGVEKNINEARRLYSITSRCSCRYQSYAIFSLCILLEEKGEFENAFAIADYYREENFFIGFVICSDFYNRGICVQKDDNVSHEYLQIAKDSKYKVDQFNLASLYKKGKGCPKNEKKAKFWTGISARNGNSEAQVSLAINYLKEKNYNNAQQWAQISANAGNPQGMWILSRIHKQMNNSEKEFEFVQKAAKLGYGAALVSLYKKKNPKFSIIFFEAAKNKSSIGLYFYGKQLIYRVGRKSLSSLLKNQSIMKMTSF